MESANDGHLATDTEKLFKDTHGLSPGEGLIIAELLKLARS